MPPPSPSAPSASRRRAAVAAVAVLVLAIGSALVLWRPQADRSGEPAGQAPGTAPPVALPAPDAGVPAPVVPSPGEAAAPANDATGLGEADDAAAPTPAPGTAYDPVPTSDNHNLSLAHRAGLQRAPNPLHLTASVALVLDGRTREVLYARNELAILPIASLSKLMTAIVVLDAHLPMDEEIRITRDDVDRLRHSRSRLRVGTRLTRGHALELALMSSENRAAHALARTYPGGVPAFVAQMNRKAAELGMSHSRFAEPTGLSNANRATAQDVATLLLAAAKYPSVRKFTTVKRHVAMFGRRKVQYLNANRLVRHSGWPITAQKTGYIVEAGHCMAMLTRAHGRPLVLVVLDAGSLTTGARDVRKLRRWGARQTESQGDAARTASPHAPIPR